MPFRGDPGNVAAAGLQGGWDALAQLIAERKKDELLRYTQEQDRLQFQQTQAKMDETSKWQQLQFEATERDREERRAHQAEQLRLQEEDRKRQEANRVADNLRGTWKETPKISGVSADEYAQAIGKGDVSRGLFTPEKIIEGRPQTFGYAGGATWQSGEENRQLREEMQRRQLGRPQIVIVPQIGPTGQIQNVAVDKRQMGHGQVVGTPAPPVGQQGQVIAAQMGTRHLTDIQRLYKPEYVGPVQGIASKLGARTGYTMNVDQPEAGVTRITPEFAAFNKAVASNKNRKIKLITGAAMNKEEIPRILEEVSDMSQPPEVFEANLAGDSALEEYLIGLITTRQMAGLPTPGIDPIGADGTVRVKGEAAPAAETPAATPPPASSTAAPPKRRVKWNPVTGVFQ